MGVSGCESSGFVVNLGASVLKALESPGFKASAL